MPLFVNAHPDVWMDGVQVAGQDLRLEQAGAFLTGASPSGSTGIASRPGVRYGTGNPLLVQAASGMNVTVNAGVAWVQGTASATAGMYTCCLDTTATLTVATSDPTNPRIDNVICQITDNGNNTSTTVVTLQTGTPAPSPVAPTLPANSLLLATVAVAAGVSSITAGNITDARVYTSATGGIVPLANTTGGISGAAGLYAHDLATGRLRVSDGSGNARAPKTVAFPAQTVVGGTQTITIGAANAVAFSTTITTDGVTECEMRFTWDQVVPGTGTASDQPTVAFFINGTLVVQASIYPSASNNYISAGNLVYFRTPAAGANVFGIGFSGSGTGGHTFSIAQTTLRISAVPG